jgi:hypothetical protein
LVVVAMFFILQIAKHSFLWEAQFFPIYFTNFLFGQLRTAARASQLRSAACAGQLLTDARAQLIVPAFAAR